METKSGRMAATRNAKTKTAGIQLPGGAVLVEKQAEDSWRTTQGGSEGLLEKHGLATAGTEPGGRESLRRGRIRLDRW